MPDGCLDGVEGVIDRADQRSAPVPLQSIRVGGESESSRSICGQPAHPSLIELIVDRDAKSGQLRQVVDGPPRGSELEVEQRNRDAVTEDDVRKLDVVVAHDRPAGRVNQAVGPRETVWVEAVSGVMQPAQESDDRNLAFDEDEALASVLVDTDGDRGSLEAGVSHGSQVGVHRVRVRTRGAKDVRTDPDDVARVSDPAVEVPLSHRPPV